MREKSLKHSIELIDKITLSTMNRNEWSPVQARLCTTAGHMEHTKSNCPQVKIEWTCWMQLRGTRFGIFTRNATGLGSQVLYRPADWPLFQSTLSKKNCCAFPFLCIYEPTQCRSRLRTISFACGVNAWSYTGACVWVSVSVRSSLKPISISASSRSHFGHSIVTAIKDIRSNSFNEKFRLGNSVNRNSGIFIVRANDSASSYTL